MNTEIVKISDILTLKIHASHETFVDLRKRFPNLKNTELDYDYEIFYKNTSNIEGFKVGKIMHPFRNSFYIVNQFNDKIIAYSPKQQYSSENMIVRKQKKINIFYFDDYNSRLLIRVITELLIRKLLNKNYFPLHASCIVSNNTAIIFLGEKNSGKSTALFSNVLFNEAFPLSNDITFVGKENGIWEAFGLPYDITFNESLFFQIDDKEKKFKNLNKKNEYGSSKIRFDIAEFNDSFNTNWIWHAPISTINIVNLNQDKDFKVFSNVKLENILMYLEKYGKDSNFSFDDFLMINNLYPIYNYDQLAKELPFNKLEGNILKYHLKKGSK